MIISLKRSVTLLITFFLTLNLMSQIRGNEVMVLIIPITMIGTNQYHEDRKSVV